jgi:hypothetical protein
LKSLKRVNSGAVAILENKHLCFADGIDWNKIKKSKDHASVVGSNRNASDCRKLSDPIFNCNISLMGSYFILQKRMDLFVQNNARRQAVGAKEQINVWSVKIWHTKAHVWRIVKSNQSKLH